MDIGVLRKPVVSQILGRASQEHAPDKEGFFYNAERR
jgi:hypothetical protein